MNISVCGEIGILVVKFWHKHLFVYFCVRTIFRGFLNFRSFFNYGMTSSYGSYRKFKIKLKKHTIFAVDNGGRGGGAHTYRYTGAKHINLSCCSCSCCEVPTCKTATEYPDARTRGLDHERDTDHAAPAMFLRTSFCEEAVSHGILSQEICMKEHALDQYTTLYPHTIRILACFFPPSILYCSSTAHTSTSCLLNANI